MQKVQRQQLNQQQPPGLDSPQPQALSPGPGQALTQTQTPPAQTQPLALVPAPPTQTQTQAPAAPAPAQSQASAAATPALTPAQPAQSTRYQTRQAAKGTRCFLMAALQLFFVMDMNNNDKELNLSSAFHERNALDDQWMTNVYP